MPFTSFITRHVFKHVFYWNTRHAFVSRIRVMYTNTRNCNSFSITAPKWHYIQRFFISPTLTLLKFGWDCFSNSSCYGCSLKWLFNLHNLRIHAIFYTNFSFFTHTYLFVFSYTFFHTQGNILITDDPRDDTNTGGYSRLCMCKATPGVDTAIATMTDEHLYQIRRT